MEPDSTAGFKQRALVEMKETAKALVSKNQNELLAARTIEVSLDRADNVIEGGPPFREALSSSIRAAAIDESRRQMIPLR